MFQAGEYIYCKISPTPRRERATGEYDITICNFWKQWWFIRSSGGALRAVVAQGSRGGSLVVTPDYETAVLAQIQQSPQPTVDCQSLDGLLSGMALCRSIGDPDPFDTDPNPAFHFETGLDPAFQFDPDLPVWYRYGSLQFQTGNVPKTVPGTSYTSLLDFPCQ